MQFQNRPELQFRLKLETDFGSKPCCLYRILTEQKVLPFGDLGWRQLQAHMLKRSKIHSKHSLINAH